METNITQLTPVEYELDIRVGREAIAERVDSQLKKLRPSVQAKGFRPGKVPIGMVKRLHGRAVAMDVVDELIQELYKNEVLESPDHDVLGSPTVTKLEYEPDGDLHAQVQFGVRPQVKLVGLAGETVKRLTHEVTDEEVGKELDKLRTRMASYEKLDQPAGDDDFVRVDLQELDHDSDTPLIGSRQEGVVFHLGADGLDERIKDALSGKSAGDKARIAIYHEGHDHDHRYDATVVDVQRRTLPVLDDALASAITEGRIETLEDLRADIDSKLREQWDQALRDKLEDDVVRRLVELHEFDVPPSVVELYIDSQIEDIARRNDGKLPHGFDIEYFRQQNRPEAERMARWMLIRDRIVENQAIEVTAEDLDEAFAEMGGDSDDNSGESVRKMFEQHYPDMVDQMRRRIENRKVFDWILDQVELEDEEWVDDRDDEDHHHHHH